MTDDQRPTKRGKTLFSFFKKKNDQNDVHRDAPSSSNAETLIQGRNQEEHQNEVDQDTPSPSNIEASSIPEVQCPTPVQFQVVEEIQIDVTSIERDPGLRKQLWEYPVNKRDEIRRAYIKEGAYQPKLSEYPKTKIENQNRRFQYIWFKQFLWLEYSPSKDKAYCFPCFLFENKIDTGSRSALVTEGFNSWKRVNDGENCVFLTHVGRSLSTHKNCERCVEDLMKPSQHIDKVLNSQPREVVLKNRLRLKASIRGVRWLAFQGCAFRGHDESINSMNRGNFIESIRFQAEINDDIARVVLENAPQNAKYTSGKIQKEILHILAKKVRGMIREQVGDACFCILVDEAQDESKKEQMAIVLRFVNSILVERFFQIVSIEDTAALTLKKEISTIFRDYDLHVENMRGQGYDGASNMSGQWNGLQALFLEECRYAYYVHCFAHRLQLALVKSAKDVGSIWQFFSHLSCIVNLVGSSPKRLNELQSAQRDEIAKMLASGERKTGKGLNQICTLHRAGATCWSSHYDSVRNLIDMCDASCRVLQSISKSGLNGSIRGEARGVYKAATTFEFIFTLHLMDTIMGITDILCQALQRKSQDILNALKLVSSTKTLLLKLREDGWDTFFEKVVSFGKQHGIDIPDMSTRYKEGRSCQELDDITNNNYYRYDVFNSTIDFQLMELNSRFNEDAVELLTLSSALDPTNSFKFFNADDISKLAKKYYPGDFTGQEIHALTCQLQHYKLDVICDPEFQKISSLSELCRELVVTKKSPHYYLIERLIRLVLTLPVSTATTERTFSAMKYIKNELRNRMSDEYLADCMTLYIEREIAEKIDLDWVVDEFYSRSSRRVQFQ